MNIPTDKETFDNGISILWWDDNGILCSQFKKNVPMTLETLMNAFDVIRKLSKNKKICMLSDISLISPPEKKEVYDYAYEENKNLLKAHALIATNFFSKMVSNMYLFLKKSPYPIKIFTDEIEAKQWLKQYI